VPLHPLRLSLAAPVTAVLAGAVLAPALAGASVVATSTPAQSTLATTLAAAKKQSSVHFVATTTVGPRSVTLNGDASSSEAQQVVTIHDGSSVGHLTARLVPTGLYFNGDAKGLETYLRVPTASAPKYAGRWIVISNSASSFSQIVSSMTIGAAVDQISLTGPLSESTALANGRHVIVLTGRTTALSSNAKTGPAELNVAAGSHLPVSFSGRGPGTTKAVAAITFSHWGEPVHLATPSSAIPASSIK